MAEVKPVSFTSIIKVSSTPLNGFINGSQHCGTGRIIPGKNLYAMGISSCIAGCATNVEDAFMFHYTRLNETFIDAIHRRIAALVTPEGEKPHILITGGYLNFPFKSEEYYKALLERLAEFRGSISTLWGHVAEGATDLHYSLEQDTFTLHHSKLSVIPEAKPINDLSAIYRDIKIASGDELWLEGVRVK
ncbi:MAG: hypothetical protein PHC64_08815 [Candidatus Gastranaerophilales bacterium]|nr:hypothetical protein [Candidatus Gastranaerophilales bacterium]